MSKCCTWISVALLLWSADESVGAPLLHIDPFAKPVFLENPGVSPGREGRPQEVIFSPKLLATIRFSNGSMANIDGEIVRLGEELDGFRLLKVTARSAVFEKYGKKFVVTMER